MAAVLFVGTVLVRCRYGFDFTDEGFYINHIAGPWRFGASLMQFGFIYHPLYRLVGSSLVALRQATLLITLALSSTVAVALIRAWPDRSTSASKLLDCLIAIVLSTASLGILAFSYQWLPTPSYNTLAFQALLLVALAVVLLAGNTRRRDAAGMMLGFAICLATAAKPTTGAAAFLLSLGCVALAGRLTWRVAMTVTGSATVAVTALAVAIDGSPLRFAARLRTAYSETTLLGGGHALGDMFRLDTYSFNTAQRELFAVIFVVAFLATSLAIRREAAARFAWTALGLASAALSIVMCRAAWAGASSWLATVLTVLTSPYQGLQVAAAALGVVTGVATTAWWKRGDRLERNRFAVCLFLVASPCAYVLGTAQNYWVPASNVTVFWLLAAIPVTGVLSGGRARAAILSMAVIAQWVAIALVLIGLENPYRQAQAVRLNTETVRLGIVGETLALSPSSAGYLRTLQAIASRHGFVPNTPVIDLTGHYPGALYALGAMPLGHAWLLGGYPGSSAFAAAGLDRVACADLARAWVLQEPAGPRAIAADLLQRYGIAPEQDMEIVGEVASPTEDSPTSHVQRLVKPVRPLSAATAACEAARARKPAGGAGAP